MSREFIIRRGRNDDCWCIADHKNPDYTRNYISRDGTPTTWDYDRRHVINIRTRKEAELALMIAKIKGDAL